MVGDSLCYMLVFFGVLGGSTTAQLNKCRFDFFYVFVLFFALHINAF